MDLRRYYISSEGYILSLRTLKTMKTAVTEKGYSRVGLYVGRKQKHLYVHRLVALKYLPNPENKPQVNHKNGDKADNRVENLEWATFSENSQHAMDMGLSEKGEHHYKSSLKTSDVREIKKLLILGWRNKTIAEVFKVKVSVISLIKTNRNWKHIKVDSTDF